MDSSRQAQIQPRNQSQHPQQQQQQQQQQHIGPSQLPDESYIERLFPKCQPKPSNPTRGGKRTARMTERHHQERQQQKRSSRNRNQHQYSRRDVEGQEQTINGLAGNIPQRPAGNLDCNKQANRTNASAKHQQLNNSSDSSDNETQAVGGKIRLVNGGVKRSSSNHFGFDAKNEADQVESPSNEARSRTRTGAGYSKPRTKKYRASKNLQQQLSRSQSSYGRLSNPPPLLGVKSEPLVGASELRPGADQRQLNACEQTELTSANLPSSSTEAVASQKVDKANRTRRGIVFAEPLQTRPVPSQTGIYVETGSREQSAVPKGDIARDPHGPVDILATRGHRQQPKQRERSPQDPRERLQTAARETADLTLAQDAPDHDTGQDIVATTTQDDPYHKFVVNNQEAKATPGSPTIIEPVGSVEADQGDDDKFINLFVYDQTVLPTQRTENLTSLSNGHKDDDSRAATENLRPETGHRLLTADFGDNEQGVISNDTSTEELCSFGDNNDTDTSLKQKLFKAKRSLEDELNLVGSHHNEREITESGTTNLASKSSLKHHRSISTLQTVDEKAEINIEEENTEPSDGNRTELIDISDTNTMVPARDEFRKGFVSPGFPQRVRPVLRAPIQGALPQSAAPCPDPPSPAHLLPIANSPTEEPAKKPESASDIEPREAKAPELCTLNPSESPPERADEFTISSESQSVVEKNLSEALSKVTLDQMIAQDFKDALSANLRHHKLPNESSHFSAVRPATSCAQDVPSMTTINRSSVQFNTLSDNESGQEETFVSSTRDNKINPVSLRGQLKRQDTPAASSLTGISRTLARGGEEATSAKTALVFPRLDEGLSSEAESNEEEAEEDDDRAMEADVDADDDEEDEEEEEDEDDGDEETESPNLATGNRQSSLQASVDSFYRHQQLLKPQNRSIGSLQQISLGQQSQDSDLQHVKAQNSAYANHNLNEEQINRADLKPTVGQSGQNGVQSNYWMAAAPNQQQATMSSQPTISPSQFTIQRNQYNNNNTSNNNNNNSSSNSNNNNGNNSNSNSNSSSNNNSAGNVNLSHSNSYGNRDDAKGANRLSSDTDNETDRLLGTQRNDQLQKLAAGEVASSNQTGESQAANSFPAKQGTNSREVQIEGVLFNVKYLGSTHTECEGRGEKEDRIQQAELAVHEVKFRNGELQPPVEAQLFISTEKIMVLDDKKRVIMMDHSLRTISYIADIGDAVVLIVRKKSLSLDTACDTGRPMSKTSCHVFESNESHTITKSISQAFQVAYTELLKANGGDPSTYPKELDYQEVLNSQEMPMTELDMFASKTNQREVIVPKQVGEILGLSIVESGWGSVLPTAVIASLKQDGPAYRCKKLSVGDQILSINGESLVGLSLAECQQKLRKTKTQSVARLWVVPCPITVEVKIKRPDTKYQLGFSVQHGVICSLLRGGIAERGGVRVGHRIISINGQTVVGVPHDKIVTLLASSVGEIRMKTCLTSLYRHMLGEEKKHQWV